MKKVFRIVSIAMVLVILSSGMSVSASSEELVSITGAKYIKYGDFYDHTAEWFFGEDRMSVSVLDEVRLETIGDTDYIYMVEDGKAYLVNVHFNVRGTQNRTLILPEKLGGYPVVAIGHPNYLFEVFWYITYGENFDEFSNYYSWVKDWLPHDYDPELRYVNKIIIPEGYKYIYEYALTGYAGSFEFPKSLKLIENYLYMDEYITGVDSFLGENTFIEPDCEFGKKFYAAFHCDNFICQSRFPGYLFVSSDPDSIGATVFTSIPRIICVPYNVTAEQSEYALFKSKVSNKLLGNTVIYCSEDSPTYAVIQANKELGEYQVVTDIPKAEYIEFPEETVNVCVGDVVGLEAKTYPAEAVWTACDYTVSDPSIVQIDDYSGRITALKEGTVTVTAKHCERGFVDTCTVKVTTEPEPVSGVKEIKPATDAPYFAYGNRDYKLELTGSPSKIQLIRENGTTTTIDRSKATITSNGDTETWVVNMRVGEGNHSIRAKYGKVWDEAKIPFTVTYDTPKAHSFDITYKNGIGTFEVVTDPQIAKVQFLLDSGSTLTYSQSYSHIAEDGMRHWTVIRKIPADTNYTLKTKLGYTWTTTDLKVTS